MSCSDFSYSPNGRRGIGVNQPQGGMDYPLVEPSADIQYLLADFHIAYSDLQQSIQHPLRIKWLYGVGCDPAAPPSGMPTPAHVADVLVVDAADVVVFDSTLATTFNTWCWGLKKTASCPSSHAYQIYEWSDAKTTCQLIAHKTWPLQSDGSDADTPRNYALSLAPESALLDERAVYKKPKHVTSFILVKKDAPPVKISQPVAELVAGYNMQMPAELNFARGLRRTNSVTFEAMPGAGLGKFVDCVNDGVVITSLNGLTGPNVILDGHDCLWVRPILTYTSTAQGRAPNARDGVLRTTTINGHATQQIGSDCKTPCCTCDDYAAIARYMNNTGDRYKNIGLQAGSVLSEHSDNIDRWVTQRQCRQGRPLKACMTPQRCAIMDVVVQYCNMCEKCAQNAVLNLEFDAGDNTAILTCGYTTVSNNRISNGQYRLNGSWPSFTAPLGNVDAGNSVSVSFRLEFLKPQPTTVQLTVNGTNDKGPIQAGCAEDTPAYTAVAFSALRCDETGKTPQICE